MSVEPPSFVDLVGAATSVIHGKVISVESRKAVSTSGRQIIRTYVTVAVSETIKGDAASTVTLSFLGGKVGDETMEVSGQTKFAVGDEDYLFVRGGAEGISPLVRVMHGRYRVMSANAAKNGYVARADGTPLTDVSQVAQPMRVLPPGVAAAAVSSALTPDAFATQIRGEVERQSAAQAQR